MERHDREEAAFAQRLKQLRKKRKLTMQELADDIGVAKSTYAGYESGYRQPTLESLQIICRRLRTTADYLLGLTDCIEPAVEINHNAKEYLRTDRSLHWDGVPLQRSDLEVIRSLLERMLRDRSVQDS